MWTPARAEQIKRTQFRKDIPDHAAFRFVPFAVETCGYMGKKLVKFVRSLRDIAAESGRVPKGSEADPIGNEAAVVAGAGEEC